MRNYTSLLVIFCLVVTGLVSCDLTGGGNLDSQDGDGNFPDVNKIASSTNSTNSTEQRLTTPVDQVVFDHVGDPLRNDEFFQAPWGQHEGLLHGLPSNFDWFHGARPSVWFQTGDNEAVSTWGQVYEWANESPVTNVRVQIRNHMLYAYANGEWVIMEDGITYGIEASLWAEDFSQSFGTHAGRDESGNGGGMSFPTVENRNIHWWEANWPRAPIPNGTEAFFISAEIRLIPDTDPNVNLSDAKYLAGVSADAYATTTSDGGSDPVPSLSITRHKFLTPEWQSFTGYIAGSQPSTVEEYRNEINSRPLPPFVGEAQPHAIPGKIEAEDFTDMSGVQTQSTTDDGGGENVGWINTGDWMDYKVDVASAGDYNVTFRVAADTENIKFDLKKDSNVLTSVNSSATGGWQVWKSVTKTVSLDAGEQTLRIAATGDDWNINWLDFTECTDCSSGSTELLENTSFESGDPPNGWVTNATLDRASGGSDGSYSGLITGRTASWMGAAQNIVDELNANGQGWYKVEAFVKRGTSENQHFQVTVNIDDSEHDWFRTVGGTIRSVKFENGWEKLQGFVYVTWDGSIEQANFKVNTAKDSYDFQVDEVSLKKQDPPSGTLSSELLANISFENGDPPSDWVTNATLDRVSGGSDGSYSGMITGRTASWMGAAQNIVDDLNANGQGWYKVEAFVKRGTSENQHFQVTVNIDDSEHDWFRTVGGTIRSVKFENGWEKLQGFVYVTWDGSIEQANFKVNTAKDSYDFQVDEVSLKKVSTL